MKSQKNIQMYLKNVLNIVWNIVKVVAKRDAGYMTRLTRELRPIIDSLSILRCMLGSH